MGRPPKLRALAVDLLRKGWTVEAVKAEGVSSRTVYRARMELEGRVPKKRYVPDHRKRDWTEVPEAVISPPPQAEACGVSSEGEDDHERGDETCCEGG